MDVSVLTPEQQADWARFGEEQLRRRVLIGELVARLRVPRLSGADVGHTPKPCPCCGTDANRNPHNSLFEDDKGGLYRSQDVYGAFLRDAESIARVMRAGEELRHAAGEVQAQHRMWDNPSLTELEFARSMTAYDAAAGAGKEGRDEQR